MKTAKKKIIISFLLICLAVLSVSCGKKSDAPVPEEAVLKAMFSCPNEELFHPDSISVIGLGVEPDERRSELQAELRAENEENWLKAVGSYFTENGFDRFMASGPSIYYHAMAAFSGCRIEVNSIETEKEDEGKSLCTVSLTLIDTDGKKTEVSAVCRVSFEQDSGKLQSVEVADDKELAELLASSAA